MSCLCGKNEEIIEKGDMKWLRKIQYSSQNVIVGTSYWADKKQYYNQGLQIPLKKYMAYQVIS